MNNPFEQLFQKKKTKGKELATLKPEDLLLWDMLGSQAEKLNKKARDLKLESEKLNWDYKLFWRDIEKKYNLEDLDLMCEDGKVYERIDAEPSQ